MDNSKELEKALDRIAAIKHELNRLVNLSVYAKIDGSQDLVIPARDIFEIVEKINKGEL